VGGAVSGFWRSYLGKKAVMAVTGVGLFGFVLVHMLGNLKLYQGADKLNAYAEWLREVGSPALPHGGALWIARIALLAMVVLHVVAAAQVAYAKLRARPVAYADTERLQSSYASRTMIWGGGIILLFVVYHLAHLTWGPKWVHDSFIPGDAYHNVVAGFRVWWISAIYIAAQVALGLHLYHGLWSLFQTMGWNHDRYNALRRRFAVVCAAAVSLGNISFPIAVLIGWVA